MRFICMIAIAIYVMAGSFALAGDPIGNTDEFIQKMAHEGDSQDSDVAVQGGNKSPIEWGDDTADTDKETGDEPKIEEKALDKGRSREEYGK